MASKHQITLGGFKRRNVQAIPNLLLESHSPKQRKANKQQLLHWTAVLLRQKPGKCSQESCMQIAACSFFNEGLGSSGVFEGFWGFSISGDSNPNPLGSGMILEHCFLRHHIGDISKIAEKENNIWYLGAEEK